MRPDCLAAHRFDARRAVGLRAGAPRTAARAGACAAVLLAATVATVAIAAGKPAPSAPDGTIEIHVGVPGLAYLGQPVADFLSHFPTAQTSPFAGQTDVSMVQVPEQGISALAMGETPAKMTLEVIGFTFGQPYEGVQPGKRRTARGIGPGSTVNDLLGAYGKPATMLAEKRHGAAQKGDAGAKPDSPMRYIYRNDDRTISTYFVVDGYEVVRMAVSRPASVRRFLMKKKPGPGPASPPGTPPGSPHGEGPVRSGSAAPGKP